MDIVSKAKDRRVIFLSGDVPRRDDGRPAARGVVTSYESIGDEF